MSSRIALEHRTAGRRSNDSGFHSNPDVETRRNAIRNGWSAGERRQRAHTARMVQWLLVGPPVGFRLIGD